jgi:hypothetical protein
MHELSHPQEPSDVPGASSEIDFESIAFNPDKPIPFGVEEFMGYVPLANELAVARNLLYTTLDTVRERHDAYASRSDIGYFLGLEYRDSASLAQLQIRSSDFSPDENVSGSYIGLAADFYDVGGPHVYSYLVGDAKTDAAVLRVPGINPQALGVPQEGSMSWEETTKRYKEIAEAEVENMKLARQAFPPEAVGIAEASRLAAMLERVEPQIVTFRSIHELADNRISARVKGVEVPKSEAREGAALHLANVRRYLEDANSPHFIKLQPSEGDLREADSMDTRVYVAAQAGEMEGVVAFKSAAAPTSKVQALFARTEAAKDSVLVALRDEVVYGVREGELWVNYQQSLVDHSGRMTPILRSAARANRADVNALNYFLRKPTF